MMFWNIFKSNKGKINVSNTKSDGALTSEKIIEFLISNINRSDLIRDIIGRFESSKKIPTQDREGILLPIYFSLEEFISTNQPLVVVRAYSKQELEAEVAKNFHISNLNDDFRLIFLPENEKWFIFFKKGLDELASYIIKHLGENRLKETTKSMKFVAGDSLDAIYSQLKTQDLTLIRESFSEMYLRFFDLVASVWDIQTAENILLNRYHFISSHYSDEYKWEFLKITPNNALKEERLKYLSHAQLEDQVKVQTKELSEETSRLHAALHNMSLGVIMSDMSGRVVSINPAAESLLSIAISTKENLMLKAILPFSADTVDLIFTKILESQKINKTLEIPEAIRLKKILHLFISPVITPENKSVIGSVIVIQDITEEKLLERAKDEVFTIASHELRTPLTAIKGYSVLLDNLLTQKFQDNEAFDMVRNIEVASDRLIQIVNDFLDISRIEQGKILFEKQKFSLNSLVNEVIQTVKPLSDKKGLTLRINATSIECFVIADPGRLKQAILNLVANAIKFTDHGGITITINKSDHIATIEVMDTGKGIDAKRQTLLFRKFQQAGESLITRDASNGTGLGLYITKLITNSMGGTVYLKRSALGQGSTFVISIPVAK